MIPDKEIQNALKVLREGGTLLYPTDTIWGIGCDATNEKAVEKVYAIKQRSESKSLIILVDDENKIARYVKDVPAVAWELIECSETPLTIVYPTATGLAKNVIAEDGSIGIRVVKDDFCAQLIRRFGKPIVSTSANTSGEKAPGNFGEISAGILHAVGYVVNLRQEETYTGKPSSIIRLGINGEVTIIRK